MKKHLLLLTLLSLFAFTHTAWGQTRPTNEERLIRVEEGVKNLDKRFDDLRYDLNKRFESIDKRFESIDKRFESIDKRFDKLEADLKGFFCIGVLVFYLAGCLYLLVLFFGIEGLQLRRLQMKQKHLKKLLTIYRKMTVALKTILKEYAKENETLLKFLNKATLL